MKKTTKKAPAPEKSEWEPATRDPLELGQSADDFKKDGAKRNRLLTLLRDPVFREAVAILEDELKPRGDLAIFLGNETVSAHRYHQQAGMTYLTDGLRRLTKEYRKPVVLRGKQLTTSLPGEPNPDT